MSGREALSSPEAALSQAFSVSGWMCVSSPRLCVCLLCVCYATERSDKAPLCVCPLLVTTCCWLVIFSSTALLPSLLTSSIQSVGNQSSQCIFGIPWKPVQGHGQSVANSFAFRVGGLYFETLILIWCRCILGHAV